MSKNNKNQKSKSMGKFVIGSSLALLLLFASILGATYLITRSTIPDEDYVKFHMGEEVYDLEDVIDMTKEEAKTFDDTTDETTGETSENDDDNDATSSNETKAKIIETEFYSLALFGTTDYQDLNGAGSKGGLFFEEGNEHNIPQSFDWVEGTDEQAKAVNYKQNFIISKLFKETYNSSVFHYLESFASDNDEINELLLEILALGDSPEPSEGDGTDTSENVAAQWTFKELASHADAGLRERIVSTLTDDLDYQQEVFEEMYTYNYLWQDSSSRMYDFNFTEALVKARPSMVSEANINLSDSTATGDAYITYLSDADDGVDVTADQWTDLLAREYIQDTDVDNSIITGGFGGFNGVQFGSTDNTNINDDFYDASKAWDVIGKNTDVTVPTTGNGLYNNKDVLFNSSLYIADGDEGTVGTGALIQSSEDFAWGKLSGDATVTAYSQLYPYMFATIEGEGVSEIVTAPQFSLYAHVNGDKEAQTLTLATQDEMPTDPDAETDVEYIFERWFPGHSDLGEIYVSEELIGYDSGLKSSALEYWNDEGYYIELSGTSSNNFLSYLPTDILEKD